MQHAATRELQTISICTGEEKVTTLCQLPPFPPMSGVLAGHKELVRILLPSGPTGFLYVLVVTAPGSTTPSDHHSDSSVETRAPSPFAAAVRHSAASA